MARTIDYWKQLMVTEKENHSELDSLDSSSRVSIWGLLLYVIASTINILDNFFDQHKTEITTILANQRPGTLPWYRTIALAFQYGRSLLADGTYDNTNFSDDEIAASKIISQAAATEATIDGIQVVRIKVVKGSGIWTQLSAVELRAFNTYMQKIKYGGVKVEATSQVPDDLKLSLDIWYDPTILDNTGARIDGTAATSVQDAIDNYLKNLEFNGEFANVRLQDALQLVDGVVLPEIKASQYRYGLFAWMDIDGRVVPDSGFFNIADSDLTINWREYDV